MDSKLYRFFLNLISVSIIAIWMTSKALSAQLIMFESSSCEWCEIWHEEIGVAYQKTPEGKFAPLRRIDIADDLPRDLAKLGLPNFTPTFILMENGKEILRIIGYPGEEFFWDLLVTGLIKIGFNSK